MKKTTAALAIAALAAPAAAQADRPDNDGTKNASERHQRNDQRQQQQRSEHHKKHGKRFKGVGFAVSGVDYKGTLTASENSKDQETLSQFTLDITSANKQARRYLGLTTRPSKKSPTADTAINDTVDGKANVRFVGFEQGETPDADDRVKVIGRVTRVKKDDTTTERKLDIRRIVIKDVDADEPKAPKQDD